MTLSVLAGTMWVCTGGAKKTLQVKDEPEIKMLFVFLFFPFLGELMSEKMVEMRKSSLKEAVGNVDRMRGTSNPDMRPLGYGAPASMF